MFKTLLTLFTFFTICTSYAQSGNYDKKIEAYQKKYVKEHEVVLKKDKKYIHFFPINENYRVDAKFTKLFDTVGFIMKTSGTKNPRYFRYGTIEFTLNESAIKLTLYQSQQLMTDSTYKDYLFLPFTDLTSGEESYGGGRYLDPKLTEIKNGHIIIDFNKAYNPYCAYTTGYNCPIPPRENYMPIAIKAGEMDYGKSTH